MIARQNKQTAHIDKSNIFILRKPKVNQHWSDADLETLRLVYPTRSTEYVAILLGRSLSGIHRKACILGIKKLDVVDDQSNVAEPNRTDLVHREAYVPTYSCVRTGADDNLKYKSRGF